MKPSVSRRGLLQVGTLSIAGLVLAACSSSPPPSPTAAAAQPASSTGATPTSQSAAAPAAPTVAKAASAASSKEPASITWSGWGDIEEQTLYKNIIAAFMQTNPNIKVTQIHIPGAGEYGQKLFPMIAAGNAPDDIRTGTQFFPDMFYQKAILDLSPYFKASPELLDSKQYFTALYNIYQMDGKYYGTVLGPTVTLMYYNVDVFNKAQLDPPSDAWTYDDFVNAAKKLTTQSGGRTTQFGGDSTLSPYTFWESMIWSKGGEVFDQMRSPTKCLLDQPPAVATFAWMQDMVWKEKVTPTAAEAQGFAGGFNSGRIAMSIDGSYQIPARRKITAFKWDIAPMPKDKTRVVTDYAGAVVVYGKTKFPDAAWEMAKYIDQDKAQQLIAENGLNTPMMTKWADSDTFLKSPGSPPHHKVRVDEMAYARNRDAYFPKWNEALNKVWTPEIDKLMLNKQTPAQTGKNLTQETEKMF